MSEIFCSGESETRTTYLADTFLAGGQFYLKPDTDTHYMESSNKQFQDLIQ